MTKILFSDIDLISFVLNDFFLFKSLLRLYCFKSQVILFAYCLFGSCVFNAFSFYLQVLCLYWFIELGMLIISVSQHAPVHCW